MFVTSWKPLLRRLGAIMTGWGRLMTLAGNPYRPERYYMRGPGPKWHAKHRGRGNSGAL